MVESGDRYKKVEVQKDSNASYIRKSTTWHRFSFTYNFQIQLVLIYVSELRNVADTSGIHLISLQLSDTVLTYVN